MSSSADIPQGGSLTVTVETGNSTGKILGSETLTLKPGAERYALKALKVGVQVRFRVRIAANAAVQSPVLRAVSLCGPAGLRGPLEHS